MSQQSSNQSVNDNNRNSRTPRGNKSNEGRIRVREHVQRQPTHDDGEREGASPHFDNMTSTLQRQADLPRQGYLPVADHTRLRPTNTIGGFSGSIIQPRMEVNAPNDQYEVEANRVADQVMRMPAGDISAWSRQAPTSPKIQLKCAACGGDDETAMRFSEAATPEVTPTIERNIQKMQGGGQPLDDNTRGFFEQRMGADFSGVRIHTDSNAIQTSRAINARAFTTGNNIAFNSGEYNPSSSAGKHLLAHELTHTVQQGTSLQLKSETETKPLEVKEKADVSIQAGFFGSIWKGIKGLGKWAWRVVKGGAAYIWTLLTETPERILRLLKHVVGIVPGVIEWVWDGLKKLVTDPTGLGKWLIDGLVGGVAWVGRLITKCLDVVGFGEVMDLIWQIVKFNTRTLTGDEIAEAQKVYGDSISYWQVRVDESSLIAALGSWFNGGGGMGVTTFHTINFNQKLSTSPGNGDMTWLIHELAHVAQMESVGSQYMGEAIAAQAGAGYSYGGPTALLGKKLSDFNREQQAEIAADFYEGVLYGPVTNHGHIISPTDRTTYQTFIDDFQRGDL